MADPTQFDHDRIGHLLADRLLRIPPFQRSYSWDDGNLDDFIADLETARKTKSAYFLGTVVFANDERENRQLVVDGQQRLTTTAVLLVAIRDLLRDYKKSKQADHIDEAYLQGYDLEAEENVERLVLNPEDQEVYDALLARAPLPSVGQSLLADAYRKLFSHAQTVAKTEADYKALIEITTQLEESVQVLVAVASDLPEAYVIFETLNDRGADLTTADLLKNYLFSQSKQNFAYVQALWITISSDFEKPADFVRFIRYDYMSRHGHVTTRKLYKEMQTDIGRGPTRAKAYVKRLDDARLVYGALKDVDHPLWDSMGFDTRDSVLAMRRFGLESSYPLILAAFAKWPNRNSAGKLFVKVTAWSIRALLAGRLGGSVAERAFSEAAKSISEGKVKNQVDVRKALNAIVTDDAEFIDDFSRYGNVTVLRAKYLLAMIEKAARAKAGKTLEGLPDWSSRTVTIEHLMPRSEAKKDEEKLAFVETLGNMALLEKSLNKNLEDKPYGEKAPTYAESTFDTTIELAVQTNWTKVEVDSRLARLAALAPIAWPAN